MPTPGHVTRLLSAIDDGDEHAAARLLEAVYDDLRRLAGAYLQNERDAQTLQATALVHEAYLRLVDWEHVTWQNRAHFFAVAARVMRHVLVDHVRGKRAAKRNGGQPVGLDDALGLTDARAFDVLALEDALSDLERIDPRQARIVELRFFGGLSIEETAHVLAVSDTTVKRDWTIAKAWFQRELKRR